VACGVSLGVVHGVSHRVESGTVRVACGVAHRVAHRVTLEMIVVWHVNEGLTQQKKKVEVQLSDAWKLLRLVSLCVLGLVVRKVMGEEMGEGMKVINYPIGIQDGEHATLQPYLHSY
jgi:hypothetical protein